MAGDPWDELRAATAALDLGLPPDFEAQARAYLAALARWERIGRLTGYASPALRVRHLLVESLMLLRVVPPPGPPLLDIGSGAGVPGLIVKLARPAWEVVLLEATRRRVNFLRDVSRRLGLTGVTVEEGRAEALGDGPLAGRFQTVTMRAVAGGSGGRGPGGPLPPARRRPGPGAGPRRGPGARDGAGGRPRRAGGIALAAAVSYNPASGAGGERSTWNTTDSRDASSRS